MLTETECRETYIANMSKLDRKELLKLARAGGLTAHKIATNRGLAELFWNHFGRDKWAFEAAKERAFA